MNLKEAFRYQNKLQHLMDEATAILENEQNVTKTEYTHLRHKVMSEAEDEITIAVPETEYAEQINEVIELLVFLLSEREKLSQAIRQAKQTAEIDFDGEISLNNKRQECARLFKRMGEIRCSETVLPGSGTGYKFNAEGNQISYRCDLKKVTTINFDRNKARSLSGLLNKKADTVSATLDQCLVNTTVVYEPPFDVNDTFAEIMERKLNKADNI